MRTLRQFASRPGSIPASTAWYLADLGEARGKQELFTRQSPQRLKVLREHAQGERNRRFTPMNAESGKSVRLFECSSVRLFSRARERPNPRTVERSPFLNRRPSAIAIPGL